MVWQRAGRRHLPIEGAHTVTFYEQALHENRPQRTGRSCNDREITATHPRLLGARDLFAPILYADVG